MKNFEKYKTAKDRVHALDQFCAGQGSCKNCVLNNLRAASLTECAFAWLDLEADVKPLECPYCGSRMIGTIATAKGISLVCACGYSTGGFCTTDGAITSHNRICRAVKAHGEEVTK